LRINKQTNKTPAADSRLAIVAIQCSAETFMVNQTSVLRINNCGKNRQVFAAANRCPIHPPQKTHRNHSGRFCLIKGEAEDYVSVSQIYLIPHLTSLGSCSESGRLYSHQKGFITLRAGQTCPDGCLVRNRAVSLNF